MSSAARDLRSSRLRRFREVAGPLAVAGILATGLLFARPTSVSAWGEYGHRLTGAVATAALPAEMPGFFRNAGAQLAYLNPEPDRWRERAERELDPALDGATAPEHFIDLELIPTDRQAGALAAPTRFAYADTLRALGLDASVVGVLPFRMIELTQQLRTDFRRWRTAPDSTRAFIEQRIIDDAGILGHYVADGSNPTHTSKHYNGWTGENPSGYTTDRGFHSRFESAYVQARIRPGDVGPLVMGRPAQVIPDVRAGVLAYLRQTNVEVPHLYDLEKASSFTPTNMDAEHLRFTAERLAAGATMLRDLWWTAWVTSGLPVTKER
jgi:hypothetical protein